MVVKEFNYKRNFTNCVDVFYRKHISLRVPINSGTKYFNYKGMFIIVLFAVVDVNYNFIPANVDCQGRISVEGGFSEIKFKKSVGQRG